MAKTENKKVDPEKAATKLSAALFQTGLFSTEDIELLSKSTLKKIKDTVKRRLNAAGIGEPLEVADKYVLGIVLNFEANKILLISKKRPSWQAGLFNGIGGKLNHAEAPLDGMIREFKEETGLDSSYADWIYVGHKTRPAAINLEGLSYRMDIFVTTRSDEDLKSAEYYPPTDEKLLYIPLNLQILKKHGVAGLSWIVAASLDTLDDGLKFSAIDSELSFKKAANETA